MKNDTKRNERQDEKKCDLTRILLKYRMIFLENRLFPIFFQVFLIFLEKSFQNIWRFHENAVPLHSL